MPPQALLFDFDGVIADTENHPRRRLAADPRASWAWQITDEVAARSMEVDDREFLADLFAEREIPGDKVDGWVAPQAGPHRGLLRYAPRVYPGVVELVGRSAAGPGWRSSRAPGARTSRPSCEPPAWPTPSS